jgi:L-lysine 6-transaminase
MSMSGGIVPQAVVSELQKHILVDGFRIVIDLEKSRGPHLVDAVTGRQFLDLYGFFGSMAVGFNHPYFNRPEVHQDLLATINTKVANADVYSSAFARFVQTFDRIASLRPLNSYFFIEGGALGVENALKAAMDWKVRKNLAAGRGERGTEILHFQRAFHGRSGYTMSLTNTDPRKTDYFAKFPWPRVSTPGIDFNLREPERTRQVLAEEQGTEAEMREILDRKADDIAAIIAETIQGEGGDNHFRKDWLLTLRRLCDEYDLLLIFDEVQCGFGTTGKMWCCEHFDVRPDLLAFGKKAQVCGVMAGPKLDEVRDNVFRLASRINSTWGGNLTDMVRCTHHLHIIEEERLVENAARVGAQLLKGLHELADEENPISAVRGRGLMIAFDLPNHEMREAFYNGLYEVGLLAIRSGEKSIRFRPALDFPASAVDQTLTLLREECQRMAGGRSLRGRDGDSAGAHRRAPALKK